MKAHAGPTLSNIEILESRIAPATLTVTTLNDSGTGSLRAAITTADAASGDKIVFNSHLQGTITLASTLPTITSAMTIAGPGPGKIIVNGNNAYRIFDIGSVNHDSPVTVSGISIVNGMTSGNGAGIYSHDSLTLSNVVITGNVANSTAASGGGVYVAPTADDANVVVKISNSFISYNTAGFVAGGLDLPGLKSISLTNTVVNGNLSGGDASGSSGGMYASINSTGTGLTISKCQFIGNISNSSFGGGLAVADANASPASKITISSTVISGNSAGSGSGGGLRIGNIASGGHVSLTGCTIQNNTVTDAAGGGIYAGEFTSLIISSSVIEGNIATGTTESGGGVFLGGTGIASVSGTKILDNRASGSGGGVSLNGECGLTLVSSTVSGNSAAISGGGVFTGTSGSTTITGDQFTNNTTPGNGAGLYLGGIFHITGSKVSGNDAGKMGGGLFAKASGGISATIKGLVVIDNIADGGGGIVLHGTNAIVTGSIISGNLASDSGGGIYCLGSTASITGTSVSGNFAAHAGGGVFIDNTSSITLQASKVTSNTALTGANTNISGSYTLA
jgi:hypothetical protein